MRSVSSRLALFSPFPCAALVAALLFAGCGEDGPSAAKVCAERAKIVCAKRSECSQTFAITRDHGTLPGCEGDEMKACMDSVTRTGSGNTPARAQSCTTAMEAQTCEQRAAGLPLAACETAVGKFTDEKSCISSNQCASSYCDIPAGQACGRCARKLALGEVCDQSADCQEGSYCPREAMAATGFCTRLVAEGMPCNEIIPLRCLTGAICVGASRTNMTDGTCITPTEVAGAPCDDRISLCKAGLRCVGIVTSAGAVVTPGTCTPLRKAVGEACDRRNRMDVDCDSSIGLYCHHELTAATGTCMKRAFAAKDDPCGTLPTGVTAVCEAGGNCSRQLNAVTGAVDTTVPGTCVARSDEGGPCNTNPDLGADCLPGHSCVLTSPGVTTDGVCRRRDYEAVCLMK